MVIASIINPDPAKSVPRFAPLMVLNTSMP